MLCYWSLFIRLTIQWGTLTVHVVRSWPREGQASGAMKKLLHVPSLCYYLFVCYHLICQPCRLAEEKVMV